jgi:Protein of unknown function (DUF2750)
VSVNEKQVEAVLALPPSKRYSHFIKKVVGWRKLWGLYDEGWAMSTSPSGVPVLPMWPEREYAERCISGEWAGYAPKEIDLDDALDNMIPMLRQRGILPGVFFSVELGSVDASLDALERDLRLELEKYP